MAGETDKFKNHIKSDNIEMFMRKTNFKNRE